MAKAYYMVSVARKKAACGHGVPNGAMGVLMLEVEEDEEPDLLVHRIDPDGEDLELLGTENRFINAEEMRELTYDSNHD